MRVYNIIATTPRIRYVYASTTNVSKARQMFKGLLAQQRLGGDMLGQLDSIFAQERITVNDIDYGLVMEDF